MFSEIKALREEKKNRKTHIDDKLRQKEKLEKDVREMQMDTEAMENCQRDLLAHYNEYAVIKKNFVP